MLQRLSCRVVLYSSEAQATLQPLTTFASLGSKSSHRPSKAHKPDLGKADSIDIISPPTFRIDMNDSSGEVILLKYQLRATTTGTAISTPVNPADFTSTCSQAELQAAALDADAPTVWPLFKGPSNVRRDLEDSAHFNTSKAETRAGYCKGGLDYAQRSCSYPELGLALHMAMYSLADRSFVSKQQFMEDRRLISMQSNAYVPMHSSSPLQMSKAWKHQVSCHGVTPQHAAGGYTNCERWVLG